MKYSVGRAARVVVARFKDGEDLMGGLHEIARKENIRAGVIYVIGALKKGRAVVGPERDVIPPVPVWKDIGESHELLAVGTLFWEADEPRVHLHAALGKRDEAVVGCLRGECDIFLVAEAVIVEIEGVQAVRRLDPETGFALLDIKNQEEII